MNIEGLFDERDFNELMFPSVMKKNVLKNTPKLAEINVFCEYSGNLKADNVIRYIACVYDRASPIRKKFESDDKKKKTWAARYAGWEADKEGVFEQEIDDILKCRNQEVNKMILEYVRLYNDPEWSLIQVGYEAYYQKLQSILSISGESDKAKDKAGTEKIKGELFNQAQQMGTDLSKMSTRITGDDNRLLRRDLYCTIEDSTRNRLNITPERIAGIA